MNLALQKKIVYIYVFRHIGTNVLKKLYYIEFMKNNGNYCTYTNNRIYATKEVFFCDRRTNKKKKKRIENVR